MRFAHRATLIMAAAILLLSCNLPHDQRGTLERVTAAQLLRVGLVENPPWVVRGPAGEPSGAEVELVKRFAAELGAMPDWRWQNEPDAMEALLNRELDLVVGGLTDQTHWQKEVGLTTAYFTDHIVVGVPTSAPLLTEIEGKNVLVAANDLASLTLVAAEKGVPVRTQSLTATDAAAARDWQLEQLEFKLTEIDLRKDKHVIAVAPGENAFLVRLEKFLKSQRSVIKGMLRTAEASK